MNAHSRTTDDLNIHADYMKAFFNVLGNTLLVSVINASIWFAITFYAYLQTRSVLVTGMLGGIYLIVTVATGIWFGSLVDHHRKKTIMQWSNIASLLIYTVCLIFYQVVDQDVFKDQSSSELWVFITLLLTGSVVGNIRSIALPTLVTILVPEKKRDRANGMVGTVTGLSFLVTSVISGFLVAAGGMLYVLILALVILAVAIVHLAIITIPEKKIVHLDGQPGKVDLRGTYKLVRGVPGLMALILFTCFNNLLGGVYMALMDAYGLALVSVETWGFLWGLLSSGLIIGGLVVSKVGLGKNPLRLLLLINVVLWLVTFAFPLRNSIVLLSIGMMIYMLLIPFAEASEQTILQKVVPVERQGRVFGFAQSVEQAASPLAALVIGPTAQFIFIPYMTDGYGARTVGDWFGTGANRGIALIFVIVGIVGLVASLLALTSKYYRQLSSRYLEDRPV